MPGKHAHKIQFKKTADPVLRKLFLMKYADIGD